MESCLTQELVSAVLAQYRLKITGIHGPLHWMRVRYNGLLIAKHSGANPKIIDLFALFHDACRENDRRDPGHGARGGQLAKTLFAQGLVNCSPEELAILVKACEDHTGGIAPAADLTIGTCWDADRLDLPRVGIDIDPTFLSNEWAKQKEVMVQASIRAVETEDHLNDIPYLRWQ